MAEIKLDADTLRLLALFESVTGARAKDIVVEEDRRIFVVEEGQIGRAIGKQAANLKRLREILKADVELVGFAADKKTFVANIFHRFDVQGVEFEEHHGRGEVARVKIPPEMKGKAIGRGGRNIALARQLAQRHHNLADVVIE